ncbi:MAG: thiosulfohydrolase SoxB [Magnetospiraceae bacterium]
MLTRRDFLQVTMAASALGLPFLNNRGAFAATEITEEDLLAFDPVGNVTLLNFTDIHAQLAPLFFREPSVNLGVGEASGLPPHLTGQEFLHHFGLTPGTAQTHAFTTVDYVDLAQNYGRIGGLAHMARAINAIRAARPDQTLLIDNGDTWQGSYAALKTQGADMVQAMNALGVDVMTAHWEFTYGENRVLELIDMLNFPFLAGNVRDTEWDETVFESTAYFDRGGVKIAVIGQAFPYTPVANPRHLIPNWSFGIQENHIRTHVEGARASGADLVVLASHNGFDVDRKLAGRVEGIDVILTGHTHDALPAVIPVGKTLLVAAGSHGKFLARLDLDVQNKQIKDYRFKLIPIFSDVLSPDPEMAKIVAALRAPYQAEMSRVLGKTESLLYRRGNFNGTFDDLICQAILDDRDTEIALSPGFRWGASLLPGQDITVEDVFTQTAITYPQVYRSEMTGQLLKDILEDVADNLFNPDPYYQQGGDMVRVGGLSYAIDISKPIGNRISDMRLLSADKPIEAEKTYQVGGWASVNPEVAGPPVYDLVSQWIERQGSVRFQPHDRIKISGA